MATNKTYLPPIEELKELNYESCSDDELAQLTSKYGYVNKHSFTNSVRKRYGLLRWRSIIKTPTENVCTDYKLPPDSSWEEHLDVIKGINKLVAFHQELPSEINICIDTEKPVGIVHSADWQLGQFGVDYDSFRQDMELIKSEPGLFAALGGDTYQNIIQPSKMGSSHNQIPISVQKGLVYLTYKRLQNKILYIGTGQHNYWTALLEGEDWDAELAKRLNLIYTKHAAKVNLKVGNILYPILRMHKSRFQSSFNLTHTCKQNQRMYSPDARIVVCEDRHVAAIEQYRYNDKECNAIRTGTYAVYDDYAQQNGFFGSHVANPTVILFPKEDRLVGFKDLQESIIYLRAVRKD